MLTISKVGLSQVYWEEEDAILLSSPGPWYILIVLQAFRGYSIPGALVMISIVDADR